MDTTTDNTELQEFWTEEFAPKILEDMVLTDDLKKTFKDMLESKTKFNVLLAGSPGIGKTTIAKIIAKALDATTLFIPCGIEGTVSVAQGKLTGLVNAEGSVRLALDGGQAKARGSRRTRLCVWNTRQQLPEDSQEYHQRVS